MAYNGSGTFVRVHSWVADRNASIKIVADRHDAEDDGFATGLTAAICKDGQTTTTGRIPFASGLGSSDGAVGTPTYSFTSDTNTGIYLSTTDDLAFASGGVRVCEVLPTGLAVTGTISSSGNAVFSTSGSFGTTLGVGTILTSNSLVTGAITSTANCAFSGSFITMGVTCSLTITNDSNDMLTLNRTGSSGIMMFIKNAGTTVGSISQNGTTTSYTTTSDRVLKECDDELTPEECARVIDALRPVSFVWKKERKPGVGFIAQEFLPIIPYGGQERVGDPDAEGWIPAAVDLSSPMPYVIGALKYLLREASNGRNC